MSGSGIQLHAASQLPVSSYFDQALYEREMQAIFGKMPRYVGHELCIPHEGHYHTLQQEGAGRTLLRTARGIELISNVCRHRQAIMLKGRGAQQGQIVCPLHRWTYDASGQSNATGTLIGAPHFEKDPCLHLNNYPLQNWNGLLFDVSKGGNVQTDLAAMQALRKFNFEGFVYDRTELH